MIQNLIFRNPISNEDETLSITIDNYDDYKWHIFTLNCENIKPMLLMILCDLNCTLEYKSGRSCKTDYPIYKENIAKYLRYLNRITNYIEYNIWFDKLIQRHIDNIIYEHNHSETMLKSGDNKTKAIPNKFIRHETTDMYTGKTKYIYDNLKTGESIESDDPNLLSVLNSKSYKKKTTKEQKKKEKAETIRLSDIQFKF